MRLQRPSTSEHNVFALRKHHHSTPKRKTRPSTASPKDFQTILQAIENTLNQRSTLTPTLNNLTRSSLLRAKPFSSEHHRSATTLHTGNARESSANRISSHISYPSWMATTTCDIGRKKKSVAYGGQRMLKPKKFQPCKKAKDEFMPYSQKKSRPAIMSPLQSRSIHVGHSKPTPTYTQARPQINKLFKRKRNQVIEYQQNNTTRIDKWQQDASQQTDTFMLLYDTTMS